MTEKTPFEKARGIAETLEGAAEELQAEQFDTAIETVTEAKETAQAIPEWRDIASDIEEAEALLVESRYEEAANQLDEVTSALEASADIAEKLAKALE